MKAEGLGWDCSLQAHKDGLETRSLQNLVLRQPVMIGGFGLRSQAELSPAAFVGDLEQALTHFAGAEGVCQQLVGVIGEGQGQVDRRWKPLHDSGCRVLTQVWSDLQREATQCADYLGKTWEAPCLLKLKE